MRVYGEKCPQCCHCQRACHNECVPVPAKPNGPVPWSGAPDPGGSLGRSPDPKFAVRSFRPRAISIPQLFKTESRLHLDIQRANHAVIN